MRMTVYRIKLAKIPEAPKTEVKKPPPTMAVISGIRTTAHCIKLAKNTRSSENRRKKNTLPSRDRSVEVDAQNTT